MSKKILSMALAVVMLISVFAFSASAADTTVSTTFPEAGKIGLRVVSDAYLGMPAGETVTVKVYYVLPDDSADFSTKDYRHNIHPIALCYNTEYFSFDAGSHAWGSYYAEFLKSPATVTNATSTTTGLFKNINAKLTANDKAKGYSACVSVTQAFISNNDYGYTGTTGYPVDVNCEVFSMTFTTAKELTSSAFIGVAEGDIGVVQTKVKYRDVDNSKTVTYNADDCIIEEAVATADIVEVNDTATTKMRPGSADGKVDLGLTGTVMKTAFEPGKEKINGTWVAPNLNAVGVQVRVNGVVQAAESGCIYELKDGREGFNYRAVITDMDVNDFDSRIEIRTYIKDVNDNIYFSNWMYIDAVEAYEAKFGA